MTLSTNDAISRFGENEERVNKFVNQNGTYQTNEASPRQVETLPSFISRKDAELNARYLINNSRGNWSSGTNYVRNDIVLKSGVIYNCLIDHTAETFATDLAANKWVIWQGLSPDANVDVLFRQGFLPYTANTVRGYGDSITVGVGASVPANAYAALLASRMKWAFSNRAISGGMIMDWIGNMISDTIADDQISFILPGFNDVRNIGNDVAKQIAYEYALYAAVAYAAIPESKKMKGNSSGIAYAGTWATSPVIGYGKYSSTIGNTATFTVSGSTVYICTTEQLAFGGKVQVSIDGVNKGTFDTMQTVSNGGAVSSISYLPMLIRIADLDDGAHTVVCTVVAKNPASSSNNFFLNWVAGSSAKSSTNARVFVGNTLRMTASGYALLGPNYNHANELATRQFCAISERVCADLGSDGLNVCYVDTSGAYDPYTMVDSDNVHPNDTGMAAIYNAFMTAFDARRSYSSQSGGPLAVRKLRKRVSSLEMKFDRASYTPTLRGFNTPGSNSYSTQIGEYSVNGNLCTVTFDIALSAALDAATAGALCVTLPFAALSTVLSNVGSVGRCAGFTLQGGSHGLYLETIPGNALAVIREANPTNEREVLPANISSTARIRGTISYPIS